jgi:hypothetical protein
MHIENEYEHGHNDEYKDGYGYEERMNMSMWIRICRRMSIEDVNKDEYENEYEHEYKDEYKDKYEYEFKSKYKPEDQFKNKCEYEHVFAYKHDVDEPA